MENEVEQLQERITELEAELAAFKRVNEELTRAVNKRKQSDG
jgi:uncharacterized coiled-coil protein SlyX